MVRFTNITAVPHPSGNRIDLTWVHPDPNQFPGVRVVRREGTHALAPQPASPRQGVVVADTNPTGAEQGKVKIRADGLYSATDSNLKGETIYYYALFPYTGDPPDYVVDRHNHTAAMATAPYNLAEQMFHLLPTVYHRYDSVLPKSQDVMAEDQSKGQLHRFLDLPGGQLDQLYSLARAMLDLHNLEKVDGRLLPLLAQWIGWQMDYRLELEVQRNDLRNAPHLYKTIGLLPTVEATVKRIVGWESRSKEFVHNVFLANRPERLNLWVLQRDESGAWSQPSAPLSVDFAYEGRSIAVYDNSATLWLFYHTLRKGQWDIWYKTYTEEQGWRPSQPVTNRRLLDKYPTAGMQNAALWLFWNVYDETRGWDIHYRTFSNGQWSPISPFEKLAPFAQSRARKQPWAVADSSNGLWLFWLEQVGAQWQLLYNRYNGEDWDLALPATFPLDNGQDPRVEGDLFVLFHGTDATQPVWVFWARQEPTGPSAHRRWRIVYRVKSSLNLATDDWGPLRSLPAGTANSQDREPAPVIDDDGNVELFWSSNRNGNWSLWRATVDRTSHAWGTAEPLTSDPYSQRNPMPVSVATGTWLIYHCNQSLTYTSTVYGATETMDARYASSTTVDARNLAKLALRGKFADFQTYTYDTGRDGQRSNGNRYARDTVGLYLTPDSDDPGVIRRNQNLLRNALREFLPAQVRPVFFIEPAE